MDIEIHMTPSAGMMMIVLFVLAIVFLFSYFEYLR